MPKGERTQLGALEKELDRIGLLLQHDAELPSATALLAGAPIAGSWWGHPLGKQLYEWLSEFERGAGALSLKLVNGKVTYVAARLWPAILVLVSAGAGERVTSLTAPAKALQKRLLAVGSARGDEFVAAGFASAKEFTAAAKELELAQLAHVDSVHTPSGAHTKVLTAWAAWGKAHALGPAPPRLAAGEALREAVASLSANAKRPPVVPFLDGAAKLTRRR